MTVDPIFNLPTLFSIQPVSHIKDQTSNNLSRDQIYICFGTLSVCEKIFLRFRFTKVGGAVASCP